MNRILYLTRGILYLIRGIHYIYWCGEMTLLSVGQEDIILILEQNRLTTFVDLVEGHPNLHSHHIRISLEAAENVI